MAGKAGRGHAPSIQLRAEALQDWDADNGEQATAGRQRRGHWSERDLRRALGVARRAGLEDFRIEIAPDGTIALVVGAGGGKVRRGR